MGKPIFLIYLLTLLSSTLSSYQLDEFHFNGFSNAGANMSLNGAAAVQTNGIIQLTNHTTRLLGHAFYQSPIRFKNISTGKALSFSTAFALAIVPEYPRLGGHGLAFAISPSKELKGAQPSQYLGLLNATDNKNASNHIFAVEFDTVQDFEFNDPNDNHVGININSMVSNASIAAGYFVNDTGKDTLLLKSGKTIQAWVDYDATSNLLAVRLSLASVKPRLPILTLEVDLSTIFHDFMYVGFSASTGLLASSHYILGWRFSMNGEAQSLSLQSLPTLPQPKAAKSNSPMIAGVSVSATIFLIFIIGLAFYIARKIKNADVIEAWEMNIGPHRFSYQELKKATRGFKDKHLLGFGGFGRVYKGTLTKSNSKNEIAVKRISHESKQGLQEFASEIASIGRLRHRNLVQLQGWCRRRADLLLVYDFMPNGSLDKYLFENPKWILSWGQRFKIIKGVATGLLYLHEEWEQTVIHRDIKAGNVLLDSEMNGRLGDFGLAKLYEHGSNPSTTKVVGTLGYLAPELTRTGKPTTSSDVFAFGALLLEVVCGRRPIEAKASPEDLILVDWVWEAWKEGLVLSVVDKRLEGEFDETEAVIVLKLGLLCSNSAPQSRPSMKQVVRYLEGEAVLPDVLMSPDANHRKRKGGSGGAGCSLEFEDFLHSYPSSSGFEKVSPWSEEVEAEATTPMSLPGGGNSATWSSGR